MGVEAHIEPGTPIEDEDDLPFWAYDQINHAVAEGWMLVYDDGEFKPDKPLLRQELARAAAYLLDDYDPNYNYSAYADYIDYTEIGPKYISAVGFGTLAHVMYGRPDTSFAPEGPLMRAELAVVLYRALTWEFPEEEDPDFADFLSLCYRVEYYANSLTNLLGTAYVMPKNLNKGDRLTPAIVRGSHLGTGWQNLYLGECPKDGKYGVALVSYPTLTREPKRDTVKVLYMPVNK